MKVQNMTSSKGNNIANQFIVELDCQIPISRTTRDDRATNRCFQSYDSLIVIIETTQDEVNVYLDAETWNYSTTTSKYRNLFLGETTKETQKKIDSGEYILTNLN